MEVPSIETPHLTLRPLQEEDAAVLHRIYQVDGVLRYFPSTTPPPLEGVQRFIQRQHKHWAEYGYGNWGILPHGADEIAGWGGLQFLPETGETEVGFLLDRSQWGKGYATQIARASLEFGFAGFDLQRIIGLVHPENIASQRVLEKCGLVFIDLKEYFGIELRRYWIERDQFL